MARGVGLGSVLGAVLGCMLVLPDFVWPFIEADSTEDGTGTVAWLPLAAMIGAAVGALSALIASAGWLVAIQSTPQHPRRAQVVGAVCAGATVLTISILTIGAATWLGAAAMVVATTISFVTAPLLGFRRHR